MYQSQAVQTKDQIGRKYVNILDVRIDSTSVSSLLRKITIDIAKSKKFYVVTPNPEQVMLAGADPDFKIILNNADISIPDGIGLIAAYRFLNLPRPTDLITRFGILLIQGLGVGFSIIFDRNWLEKDLKVIRGRELFLELISLANKNGWKVFFLGGENGEANGTKKVLERNYKNIKIEASGLPTIMTNGYAKTKDGTDEELRVIEKINHFSPDILFIGMSAPRQEKWMYRYFSMLNIGGAMMVGGTFRYLSGQVKLPPKFIADTGLEWLWRLLTGSQKSKRVTTAVWKFPLTVFLYKLNNKISRIF